jgi:hypothetical protein
VSQVRDAVEGGGTVAKVRRIAAAKDDKPRLIETKKNGATP